MAGIAGDQSSTVKSTMRVLHPPMRKKNLPTKRISSFMSVYRSEKVVEWVVKQRGHQAVSEELQPSYSSWIMFLVLFTLRNPT